MRIAVFSKGFIVAKEQDKSFLFSVPQGTQQVLKENGIETPGIVFTSCLKSPGYGELDKEVIHFREQGYNQEEIEITPIIKKHGTDYSLVTKDAKVLFSERGDVSAQDVEVYDLAIIKNKHRCDKFDNKVITWPWIDQEFIVKEHTMTLMDEKLKVWSDMKDAPDNLKAIDGAKLSLDQVNLLARIAEASGKNGKENWAIAISTFKKGHKKQGETWVEKDKKKEKEMEEMKLAPEDAGYDKKGGDGVKACANCEYYKTNLTCCKVDGSIAPNGVCNIWEWSEPEDKEDDEIPTAMRAAMESYMSEKSLGSDADLLSFAYMSQIVEPSKKNIDGIATGGCWYMDADVDKKIVYATYDSVQYAIPYQVENDKIIFAPKTQWKKVVKTWQPVSIEEELKEDLTEEPNFNITIFKDEKGQDRWASISSIATWDKQKELFSIKAMDWALGFSRLTGYKGPLRYKHIPGLDGGDCDTQYRVGDFLFESGTFRDNKIGVQMKEQLSNGQPWQISVGLLFAKDDIMDGVYQRAAIFERSMTQRPALPCSVIIKNKDEEPKMNILTEAELKAAADELKMELTEVKTMYERALAAGTPFADKDAFKEALKADQPEEEVVEEVEQAEEVEEYTEEQMKEIVAGLSEQEFKQLEGLLAEVKEKKLPPWLKKNEDGKVVPAKEEEEEEEEEKPKKAMKEDKLVEAITKQGELLMAQTKALGDLAAAMTNQKDERALNQAVTKVMSGLPRKQAAQFVTQEKQAPGKKPNSVDEVILAKLKEIEEQVKKQSGAPSMYDAFTSPNLNK